MLACSSTGSCSTRTTWRRRSARRSVRRSWPSSRTDAAVGIDEPQGQRRDRRLAAAAGADDRHRVARRALEAHLVEHADAAVGGERHLLEARGRRPRWRARGRSAPPARRSARRAAPARGATTPCAVARRGVETHQRLDRRHHAHLVGDEGGEGPERQRALDHAPAAVEEHRSTRPATGAGPGRPPAR